MDDPPWPEHLLASNHPVRTWSSRSDETWDIIRRDYLAGAPARDLCDRYDVALSTLRLRAKEGGWRRADQADSDLFPADADRWVADETEDAAAVGDEDWADLAERARFRLRRAIASGRAAEAASWLRVHDRLRALAAAEVGASDRSAAPEPASRPEPVPDPVVAAAAMAARIGSLARRAARATDEADFHAIEAEIEALKTRAVALPGATEPPDDDQTLDSLDSLDPVFSDPDEVAPMPDRAALLRTRERRLELGLGVSDLDQTLADLDRAWSGSGLSPGTRPDPETPAPPPSSAGQAPGCGAENSRSG